MPRLYGYRQGSTSFRSIGEDLPVLRLHIGTKQWRTHYDLCSLQRMYGRRFPFGHGRLLGAHVASSETMYELWECGREDLAAQPSNSTHGTPSPHFRNSRPRQGDDPPRSRSHRSLGCLVSESRPGCHEALGTRHPGHDNRKQGHILNHLAHFMTQA